MKQKKILISACLVGQNVRYNAEMLFLEHRIIRLWQSQNLLIPVCPEVEGGLPVPREPAEITDGNGNSVLKNLTRVISVSGKNVTDQFIDGAKKTLELALQHQVSMAILKERSPSCGHRQIYNGLFHGNTKTGMGVTAALLIKNGVVVFSEEELESAHRSWLKDG
jgi:uncharacterized protein YbbK (DUF523 family)